MNSISGFFLYPNKNPSSWLELTGDCLLSPLSTLLDGKTFVVLKNEKTAARCSFVLARDNPSPYWTTSAKVLSVAALPIAMIGALVKATSLVVSRDTREVYFHWKTPLQPKVPFLEMDSKYLTQRGENMTQLIDFAISNSAAPQLLDEIIFHPHTYLVEMQSFLGECAVFLPPFLSECACFRSGNFNRFKNHRRKDLEDQLVRETTESFPPQANFRLNYIGFGAGHLLQDFIHVGKLIHAGYNDLKIILIDPMLDLKQETPKLRLEHFRKLLQPAAAQKGIKIEIVTFKNITEYRDAFPNEQAHVISAVDFDDHEEAFDDEMRCHKVLHAKGKFYLSYGLFDFCFEAQRCLSVKQHRGQPKQVVSSFQELNADVQFLSEELLKRKQKIVRYAMLGSEFSFEEWTKCLPSLAQSGCESIEFVLIQPIKKDYFGCPNGPNYQYTKANLEHYLKLFLPEKMSVVVTLIDSIDVFKKQVESSGQFDMITWLGHATRDEEAAKRDVCWIRQYALKGNFYCAMEIYDRLDTKRVLYDGFWRWNADSGIKHFKMPTPREASAFTEMMLFGTEKK